MYNDASQGFCLDQNCVENSAAVSLSEDAYANYVMRTVLDVVEDCQRRDRLYDMLVSNLEELVRNGHYFLCWYSCLGLSSALRG